MYVKTRVFPLYRKTVYNLLKLQLIEITI